MLDRTKEKCAGHAGAAQHPWRLSILMGTLPACGVFDTDARAVSLDPPLNHWLYQLPEADQTALVSATVQAQDEQGKPVSKATVKRSFCRRISSSAKASDLPPSTRSCAATTSHGSTAGSARR